MRTLFASAAIFAAAYAVELGSGATQAEHEAFLNHLAQEGMTIAQADSFGFREKMFAITDRWINKQNAAAIKADGPNAVQYGHNQFSTMSPREKMKVLGISKKLQKFMKKWFKKMREADSDSDSESDASDSESDASDSDSDSDSNASDQEASDDDSNGPVSPIDPNEENNDDSEPEPTPTPAAVGIDWRQKGVVEKVKNQGSCGSCWAFAAGSQLESLYAIKYGTLYSFSEQQLVDCATKGNGGCNGGFMSYVFDYYTNTNGMNLDTEYPYTAKQSTCQAEGKTQYALTPRLSNTLQNLSADEYKTQLAISPISIAVAAGNNYFMNYASGILKTDKCPTSIDHAVVMVGWGEDATTKEQFWIVRNSWSAGWGESGYIRMAMSETGTGTCMAQYLAVITRLD